MLLLPAVPLFHARRLENIVGYVPATYNLMDSGQDFRPDVFGLSAVSHTWSTTNASITTGVLSPAGDLTAQKLVEGSANSAHRVYVGSNDGAPGTNTSYLSVNQIDAVVWRLACIAQPAGRSRIVLNVAAGFTGAPETISVGFDLDGVQTGYNNVTGAGWTIVGTPSIQSIGAGWCLCLVDFTFAAANPTVRRNPTPYINLDNGSGTAANSVSYAGGGVAGVNLWWFNMLPRGAWSLSNTAFFDDFKSISTIDVSDTRAVGFNWYPHNDWPNNSMYNAGNASFFRSSATPAGYISESDSVLTLSTDISTFGSGLVTAATAANPAGYVGQVWPLSFLAETKAGWDWNIGTFSVPAFWTSAIELLVGTAPLNGRFSELDFYEGGAGNPGSEPFGPSSGFRTFKIESFVGDVVTQVVSAGAGTDASITRHLYSSLWLGPADNDGVWGARFNFFNGVMTLNGDGHWSAIAAYNATDSGLHPFGLWKETNYENFPIIIGAGLARPMTMDWVKLYNNPSPPPVLYSTSVSLSGSTGTLITSATQSGGTLYWVATANGTIPTVAQIKAGQTASSVTALVHGSQAVSASGVQPSISITGFTAGLYTYIVQDNGLVSNIDGADKLTYVGPAEIVASAVGWWSLRAKSNASIGNNIVRLRESGGSTEQNFVSIAGGGLDLAAIAAFKGANNLFVVTLYDQSGNGYNATQAVQANQPAFTLNAIGSLPGITYVAATPTWLEVKTLAGYTAAATPPFSVSAVVKPSSIGSSIEGVYGTNGGSGVDIRIDVAGTLTFAKSSVANILVSSGTLTNNVTTDLMLTYNGTNSAFYILGTASGTATVVQTFSANEINFGLEAGVGAGKLNGIMPETGFWGSVLNATQASNINANQRSYWGF